MHLIDIFGLFSVIRRTPRFFKNETVILATKYAPILHGNQPMKEVLRSVL